MIERRAFAKLNLDLRVTAARADGYHELATVFQTISLCDVLRFEVTSPKAPFELECDDPAVPSDERNLIWRSATIVWEAAGRRPPTRGVRVSVQKAIPAEGGLGGGSANAAVALVAFAHLWQVSLPPAGWLDAAAAVGADVPFFLVGGTARGVGRGDQIQPWPDAPPLDVVLVLPPFGVATRDAFGWFDEAGRPTPPAVRPSDDAEWPGWLSACRNDLEPVVAARHPELAEIGRLLRASGALHAAMSGSGSTMFGLFEDPGQAEVAAHVLAHAGWPVRRAQFVDRAHYGVAALGSEDPLVPLPLDSTIV